MSDGCHDDSLLAKNVLSATRIRGADRIIGSNCVAPGCRSSPFEEQRYPGHKTWFSVQRKQLSNQGRQIAGAVPFSESESRFHWVRIATIWSMPVSISRSDRCTGLRPSPHYRLWVVIALVQAPQSAPHGRVGPRRRRARQGAPRRAVFQPQPSSMLDWRRCL